MSLICRSDQNRPRVDLDAPGPRGLHRDPPSIGSPFTADERCSPRRPEVLTGSKLKRPDVGQLAGLVTPREPAFVRSGCAAVVSVADGRTAGQEGHRLGGTAVVLQRAQEGVDHRAAGCAADDVAVDPVDDSGAAIGVAHQVVVGSGYRPGDVRRIEFPICLEVAGNDGVGEVEDRVTSTLPAPVAEMAQHFSARTRTPSFVAVP